MKGLKYLALTICLCLLLGMLPMSVFADSSAGQDFLSITSYNAEVSGTKVTLTVGGVIDNREGASFYVAAYDTHGKILALSDVVNQTLNNIWSCSINLTQEQYVTFKELKTFILSEGNAPKKAQAELVRVVPGDELNSQSRQDFDDEDKINTTWLIEENTILDVKTDIELEGVILNQGTLNVLKGEGFEGEIKISGSIVNEGELHNENVIQINGGVLENEGKLDNKNFINVNEGGSFVNGKDAEYSGQLSGDGQSYDSRINVNPGGTLSNNGTISDEVQIGADFDDNGELVIGKIDGSGEVVKPEGSEGEETETTPRTFVSVYNEAEFKKALEINNQTEIEIRPYGFVLSDTPYFLQEGTTLFVESSCWDEDSQQNVPNTFAIGSGVQLTLQSGSRAEFRNNMELRGTIVVNDGAELNVVSSDGDTENDVKTFTINGGYLINRGSVSLRGENGEYKGKFEDKYGGFSNFGSFRRENYEVKCPGLIGSPRELADAIGDEETYNVNVSALFCDTDPDLSYNMNSLDAENAKYVVEIPSGKNVVIDGLEHFDSNNRMYAYGLVVATGASLELKNFDLCLTNTDSFITLEEGASLKLLNAELSVDGSIWGEEINNDTSINIGENANLEIGSTEEWGTLRFGGEIRNSGTITNYSWLEINGERYRAGENGIIRETRTINSLAHKVGERLSQVNTLAIEGLSPDPESLKANTPAAISGETWTRWIDDRASEPDPNYNDLLGLAIMARAGVFENYYDLAGTFESNRTMPFQEFRELLTDLAQAAIGSDTIPDGALKDFLDSIDFDNPEFYYTGKACSDGHSNWIEWQFDALFDQYYNALQLNLARETSSITQIQVRRTIDPEDQNNIVEEVLVTTDGDQWTRWNDDAITALKFTEPLTISGYLSEGIENDDYAGEIRFINCEFAQGLTVIGGDNLTSYNIRFNDSCTGGVSVVLPKGYESAGDYLAAVNNRWNSTRLYGVNNLTISVSGFAGINESSNVKVNGLNINNSESDREVRIDVRWDEFSDDNGSKGYISTIQVDTDDSDTNNGFAVITTNQFEEYSGKLRIGGYVDMSGVELGAGAMAEFSNSRENNYFKLGQQKFYVWNGDCNITLDGGVTESESSCCFSLVNGAQLTSRNEWAQFVVGGVDVGQPHIYGEDPSQYGIFIPSTSLTRNNIDLERWCWDDETQQDVLQPIEYVLNVIAEEQKTHIERGTGDWFDSNEGLRLTIDHNGCKLIIDNVMLKFVSFDEFAHRMVDLQQVKDANLTTSGKAFADADEWAKIDGWPEDSEEIKFWSYVVAHTGLTPRQLEYWDDDEQCNKFKAEWCFNDYIQYSEARQIVEGLYKAVSGGKVRSINLDGKGDDHLLHYVEMNEYINRFTEALNTETVSTYTELVNALASSNSTIEIAGDAKITAEGDITVPAGKKLNIVQGAELDMGSYTLCLAEGTAEGWDYDDNDNPYATGVFTELNNDGTVTVGEKGTLLLEEYACFNNNDMGRLIVAGATVLQGKETTVLTDNSGSSLTLHGYRDPENPRNLEFTEWNDERDGNWWFDIGNGSRLYNSGYAEFDGADVVIEGRCGLDINKSWWIEDDSIATSSGLVALANGTVMDTSGFINIQNNYIDSENGEIKACLSLACGTVINMTNGNINNNGAIELYGTINCFGSSEIHNNNSGDGGLIDIKSSGLLALTVRDEDVIVEKDGSIWWDPSILWNQGNIVVGGALNDTASSIKNYGAITVSEGGLLTKLPYPVEITGESTYYLNKPFENEGVLDVSGHVILGSDQYPLDSTTLRCGLESVLKIQEGASFENYGHIAACGSRFYYNDESQQYERFEDNEIHCASIDLERIGGKGAADVEIEVFDAEGLLEILQDEDDYFTGCVMRNDITIAQDDVDGGVINTGKYLVIGESLTLTLDGVSLNMKDDWLVNYGGIGLLNGATITISGTDEGLYGYEGDENEQGIRITRNLEQHTITIIGTAAFAESWDDMLAQFAAENIDTVVVNSVISSEDCTAGNNNLVIPAGKSLFITPNGRLTVTDGCSITLEDGDSENYTVAFNENEWNPYIDTVHSYMENHGSLELESGAGFTVGKLDTFCNNGIFNAKEGSTVSILGDDTLVSGIWTVNGDGELTINTEFAGENPDDGWNWLNLTDGGVINNESADMTIAGELNIAAGAALNNFSSFGENWDQIQGVLTLSGSGDVKGSISNGMDFGIDEDGFYWSPSLVSFEGADYGFSDGVIQNYGIMNVDAESALAFEGESYFANNFNWPGEIEWEDGYPAVFNLEGKMTLKASIGTENNKALHTLVDNFATFIVMDGGVLTSIGGDIQNHGGMEISGQAIMTANDYKDEENKVSAGAIVDNYNIFRLYGDFEISSLSIFENYGEFEFGDMATLVNEGFIRNCVEEEKDGDEQPCGNMPELDERIINACTGEGFYCPIAIVHTTDGFLDAIDKDYIVASIEGNVILDESNNPGALGIHVYVSESGSLVLNNTDLSMYNCGIECDGNLVLVGSSTITITGESYEDDKCYFKLKEGEEDGYIVTVSEETTKITVAGTALPEGHAYACSWDELDGLVGNADIHVIGISGNVESTGNVYSITVPEDKSLYIMSWSTLRVLDGYSLTLEGGDQENVFRRNMGNLFLEDGSEFTVSESGVFWNDGVFFATDASAVTIEKDSCMVNRGGFMRINGILNISKNSSLRNNSIIDGSDPTNSDCRHTGLLQLSGTNTIEGTITNFVATQEPDEGFVVCPSEIQFVDGADYTLEGKVNNEGMVVIDASSSVNLVDDSCFTNDFTQAARVEFYQSQGADEDSLYYPAELIVHGTLSIDDTAYLKNYGTVQIRDGGLLSVNDNCAQSWGYFAVEEGGSLELAGGNFFTYNMFDLQGSVTIAPGCMFEFSRNVWMGESAYVTNNGVICSCVYEENDSVPAKTEVSGVEGTITYGAYVDTRNGLADAISKGYNSATLCENMELTGDITAENFSIAVDGGVTLTLSGCTLTINNGGISGEGKVVLDKDSTIIISGEARSFGCSTEGLSVENVEDSIVITCAGVI